MGAILFLMVTGTLPYNKEAQTQDPLYKFVYMKKRHQFWKTWRKVNSRPDIDDEMPEPQTNLV